MSRFILSLAALLAFACATPAFAETPERHAVVVRHADLALDREAGAAAMLARLERAANRACGVRRSERRLEMRHAMRVCARAALDEAVAQLNAPMVASLYRRGDSSVVVASTR